MSRLDKLEAAVADLKERIIKAEAWSGGCAIDWMMREDAKKIRTILEYHGVWNGAPKPINAKNSRICHQCGHYLLREVPANCPNCGTEV